MIAQAKIDEEHRRAARRASRRNGSHETQRERVRQSVLMRPEPRPAGQREV